MNIIEKHAKNILLGRPAVLELPAEASWESFNITAQKVQRLTNEIPDNYPTHLAPGTFLAVELKYRTSSNINLLYHEDHLQNIRIQKSQFANFTLLWWYVKMPTVAEYEENRIIKQHTLNLSLEHPLSFKLGYKNEICPYIELKKVHYNSLEAVDFNTLGAGVQLAFCYQNTNPVLYIAYNKSHLAQMERWIKEGTYTFDDFNFFKIKIPSETLLQHYKNLSLKEPKILELGKITDIPLSWEFEDTTYKSFDEIAEKPRTNFLACCLREKNPNYFLIYNVEQLREIQNAYRFEKVRFFHIDMPTPPPRVDYAPDEMFQFEV